MQPIITESAQFFTATILEWEELLKAEKYKDIIISSVNAFVIMDNHVDLNSAVGEAITSKLCSTVTAMSRGTEHNGGKKLQL